ncbi:MAG: TlpA family protein disulfide reductase [Pirellulales bacterium]|nr:TlpA family protein disulfide reductase [Pirellulales bacterium]
MRICSQGWVVAAAIGLLAVCPGCGGSNDAGADNRQPSPSEVQSGTTDDVPDSEAAPAVDQPPAAEPARTIPKVELAEQDYATCLVRVGDPLPEGTLPDTSGQLHKLTDLRGERLTVICFWAGGKPPYGPLRAAGLLEDLQKDYAQPYAEKGLRVIGVNQGDAADAAQQQIQAAGVTFPVLLDPLGAYFAGIATEKLPRLYVLDAQGKILWFDIEYSEITRDKLRQAVEVAMQEK